VRPVAFVLPWIQIARMLWGSSDSFPRLYVIHKKSRATRIIRGADKMHQDR
jgi:hypothetical protein